MINRLRNNKIIAQWNLLHFAYILCAMVYYELLLHWTTSLDYTMNYGTMLLFSLCYGVLLSIVTWLSFGRVLTALLLAAGTVFFCTQYFLHRSFQNFMGIAALTAADDVAGGFAGTIIQMLLKGWWAILLFALPFLVYLACGKALYIGQKRMWKQVISAVLVGSMLFGFGFCSVYTQEDQLGKYRNQYEFSIACQSFGLLTGTRLDLKYLLFGNDGSTQLQSVELDTITNSSDNEEFNKNDPVIYQENIINIDFSAVGGTNLDTRVQEMNDYIGAQHGSMQHEYTGLFAGKNLILITAEAFSAELIDPELTPTLYRLANNGIRFNQHYQPAWGGSTSTGEFSNLTGLIPTQGVSSMQLTADKNMYFTMGNQLQRQGYFSRAYHNNDYTYYDRHLTHCNLGYSEFIGYGNGMEAAVTDVWPQSDLEMVTFTLPDYIDRQPFSVYYMSVSGHGTYQIGGNAMTEKNWQAVEAMDASDAIKGYYVANLEFEYAMSYLVSSLEEAGIADDTVIVIAADHYPYALEASATWGNSVNYLPELYGHAADSNMSRDHSALIIWSGCLETDNLQIQVDTPTYSVDVLPTLSNLFGLEYDSRLLVGRDALSDQMPLVIWRDYSWLTDQGYYDAAAGVFTPADGCVVDDSYVESVKALVQNKYALSNMVLDYDYYGILFGEDKIS